MTDFLKSLGSEIGFEKLFYVGVWKETETETEIESLTFFSEIFFDKENGVGKIPFVEWDCGDIFSEIAEKDFDGLHMSEGEIFDKPSHPFFLGVNIFFSQMILEDSVFFEEV